MKNIYIFIYTEYHLLLFLNHYLNNKSNYNYKLFLPSKRLRRFKYSLDFSSLNIDSEEMPSILSVKDDFDDFHINLIKRIEKNSPDIIILFQENSLLSSLLVSKFSVKIEFWLFQDGMKPYAKIKSLSILKDKFELVIWMFKNRFYPFVVFNVFNPYSYGNLIGVNKLGLTHSEAYYNWSSCLLEDITFDNPVELNTLLKKVLVINHSLILENQIIYFNQPLHNFDVNKEFEVINRIREAKKLSKVYIKLHPLTQPEYFEKCSKMDWIVLLDSTIPAEMYLLNTRNSIILSIYSTILLFNTPTNVYYSLHKILLGDNNFYNKKFDFSTMPSNKINIVEYIDQITF